MPVIRQFATLSPGRRAFIFALGICAIYGIVACLVRTGVGYDTQVGLRVADSMRAGAPFNVLVYPDPADIARNTSGFLTVWSPGQYVFVYLLEQVGLSLGLSISVVVSIAGFLALSGWHRLYRAFGFSRELSGLTTLIVACSQWFALPYGLFGTGDLLLVACAPWLVIALIGIDTSRARAVPIVAGLLAIAAMVKLTGIVFMVAALAADLARRLDAGTARPVRAFILPAGGATVFLLLFRMLWTHRGATAVTPSQMLSVSEVVENLPHVVMHLVTSSVSLTALLDRLLLFPGHALANSGTVDFLIASLLAIPLTLLSCLALLQTARTNRQFAVFTGVLVLAYGAMLASTFGLGGAVSIEERHCLTASILLLPAFVLTAARVRPSVARCGLSLVALSFCLYGTGSFAARLLQNLHRPLGARGFRLTGTAGGAATFVHARLADARRRGLEPLMYSTEPEVYLEYFGEARLLANHGDLDPADYGRRFVYRGRTGRTIIMVPRRLVATGRADAMKAEFVDYDRNGWRTVTIGETVIFEQ